MLPGRKSAFRAGFWPDCYRCFPGSSPAKIWPGRLIYGPEASLRNIEYLGEGLGGSFRGSFCCFLVDLCGILGSFLALLGPYWPLWAPSEYLKVRCFKGYQRRGPRSLPWWEGKLIWPWPLVGDAALEIPHALRGCPLAVIKNIYF